MNRQQWQGIGIAAATVVVANGLMILAGSLDAYWGVVLVIPFYLFGLGSGVILYLRGRRRGR